MPLPGEPARWLATAWLIDSRVATLNQMVQHLLSPLDVRSPPLADGTRRGVLEQLGGWRGLHHGVGRALLT